LHIGVNGGSKVPDVPPIFRWKAPSGEEVLVHYDVGYGSKYIAEGMTDALVIENSQDNLGPPSVEEVKVVYRRLSEAFPGAEILASTLDGFAATLMPRAETFPLVESEIGDTWIHGIASDPAKVARYRELLRLRSRWVMEGRFEETSPAYRSFMGSLLMVPEHTWGLDFKKYLADYKNWSADDFATARARDLVGSDSVPEELRFIEEFVEKEYERLFPNGAEHRRRRTYSFFESSHAEKRAYVDAALAALPPSLRMEANNALTDLIPHRPCSFEGTAKDVMYSVVRSSAAVTAAKNHASSIVLQPEHPVHLGPWTVIFAPDGSLASLSRDSLQELVGCEGVGVYRYESFCPEDYEIWIQSYIRDFQSNAPWVLPDFGKPGLDAVLPRPQHLLFAPVLRSLRVISDAGSIKRCDSEDASIEVETVLEVSEGTPRGAPRILVLRYRFHGDGSGLEVSVDWFDKEAVRLPEALWFSFDLTAASLSCRMIKLGLSLDPADTVPGGARHIHAVEALRYGDAGNADRYIAELRPLDSPLVSFGERKLLRYDDTAAKTSGTVHFNLYNNIWGTNFPLWNGENGRSRFILSWENQS